MRSTEHLVIGQANISKPRQRHCLHIRASLNRTFYFLNFTVHFISSPSEVPDGQDWCYSIARQRHSYRTDDRWFYWGLRTDVQDNKAQTRRQSTDRAIYCASSRKIPERSTRWRLCSSSNRRFLGTAALTYATRGWSCHIRVLLDPF